MSTPVNHTTIEHNNNNVFQDADYALSIAEGYINCLPNGLESLQNMTILDIGPGVNLGEVLVLKCLGAGKVFAADRFLCRYQDDYHTPLYEHLRVLLQNKFSTVDCSSLEICIKTRSHHESAIICTECPLEELAIQYPSIFDITVSNAVFEHLYNPLDAFHSLYALMAPGALGYHQVDFRDHRDFSRPLEYLLYDEFTFNSLLHERHAECGNRLRPHEMHEMLMQAGFSHIQFYPNMWAELEYLKTFIPRLRRARATPYHVIDSSILLEISGQFRIKK